MKSRTTVPTKTSGMAIASLVLSLLFFYGVGSIIAIVLGFRARREIEASNGTLQGRGMATAGIVIGFIGVFLAILIFVMLATI